MSILYMEGFDDGAWDYRDGTSTVPAPSASYARPGGVKGIDVGAIPGYWSTTQADYSVITSGDTVWWSFYMNLRQSTASDWLLAFDFVGRSSDAFRVTGTGTAAGGETVGLSLQAYASSGPNPIVTAPSCVTFGVWHFVQLEMLFSVTVGVLRIWVDGQLKGELTGVDTFKTPGSNATWRFAGTNSYVDEFYIDDFLINTSQGSYNNTRPNPYRIHSLLPTGNGNSSLLTGSDGNSTDNYLQVNSDDPSEASYNGSATEGNKDTYAMADLSDTTNSVLGVAVHSLRSKTDAGAKFMRSVLRTNSVDYPQTSYALAEGVTSFVDIVEENPNTTAAWTATQVNALEVGAEVRDS